LRQTWIADIADVTAKLRAAAAGLAWHGEHHAAHITHLRARMGWE
jgi:hypothetical protein